MSDRIQKLVEVDGNNLSGLDRPTSFVVTISRSVIRKLLAICHAGLDYSDMVDISLGGFKPLDEDGDEIKVLNWRPTHAIIRVNGQFGQNNLRNDVRVVVGNRDVEGEAMWGYLQLSDEEVAHLLGEDGGEAEEGEFTVSATTTIERCSIVVRGTKGGILARCENDTEFLNGLLNAKELSSDTTFHVEVKQ